MHHLSWSSKKRSPSFLLCRTSPDLFRVQQTRFAILSSLQAKLQSNSTSKKPFGRKNASTTQLKELFSTYLNQENQILSQNFTPFYLNYDILHNPSPPTASEHTGVHIPQVESRWAKAILFKLQYFWWKLVFFGF